MTSAFPNKLPPVRFYNILHRGDWKFKENRAAKFDIDEYYNLYDNRKIFFKMCEGKVKSYAGQVKKHDSDLSVERG